MDCGSLDGATVNTATYLLGGWAYLIGLAALLFGADSSLFQSITAQATSGSAYTMVSAILVAALSFPVGYVINQLWYVVYSATIDVHLSIFRSDRQLFGLPKAKLGRWHEALLNELLLAVYHRRIYGENLGELLSWHRNRLNHLHSVASIMTGLAFSLVTAEVFFFQQGGWSGLLRAIGLQFPVLAGLSGVLLLLGINAYRAFVMLVLYNRIHLGPDFSEQFASRSARIAYLFPPISTNKIQTFPSTKGKS
jgi:hypothetical protein